MKYVDMNEVAFDETSVVFPGLGNCHGIVFVNTFGLFAYHAYGNPADSRGKHEAFGSFVRNHQKGGGQGLGLFGACPTNRYTNGDTDHKAELAVIAEALKYKGKIKGCRWDIEKLIWRTSFCGYERTGTDVAIRIANFSSGTSNRGSNPSGFNHKSVGQTKAGSMKGGLAFPSQDLLSIGFSTCKALDEVITSISAVPNTQVIKPHTL